ncbi:MAG TPA: hypothetical protein VNT31_10595 [Nocardioides sp.]|nr:hypothetical protein [Nocardioides sp.]
MKVVDADQLLTDLLEELSVDWCDVGWAYGLGVDRGLSGAPARDTGLGAIRLGLLDELFVAGDVDFEGFTAWTEQGVAAAERIRALWLAQGSMNPDGPNIAWLAITDRGRAALARRQASAEPSPECDQ